MAGNPSNGNGARGASKRKANGAPGKSGRADAQADARAEVIETGRMKILNQRYELVHPSTLKPYPGNANHGDMQAVEASVDANGFYGAVVAQVSTRFVLVGNHRLIAAQRFEAEQIPCIWVDCDDKTARRINLVDNRTGELAKRDNMQLLAILEQVRNDDDFHGTGYDEADYAKLLEKMARDAAGDIEVEEVDVSDVHDEFWLSARGPLPKQPEALAKLRDALAEIEGVTVDLGTTEY